MRQNQFPFEVISSVLQVRSSHIKHCRIFYWNFFCHFIFSFSSSGFLSSAHETCGWGRSLTFHVIKIIMLRQQTNHKVLVRPLLLQRGTKLEEILPCRTGKNVVPIAWKEKNGHWCYKTVSLPEFARNLKVICFAFVSKVASQNGACLLIVFVSYVIATFNGYSLTKSSLESKVSTKWQYLVDWMS